MDLIFSQSDDVVTPLLVEWLNFIDVVRFDKACACSKRHLENLHRVYAVKQVIFHNSINDLIDYSGLDMKGFLHWLLQSKIKLAELVIVPQMVADGPLLVESYFKLCGSTISSLSIAIYDTIIFSAAMEFCPCIKKLSIDTGWTEVDVDLFSQSVETFCIKCMFGGIYTSISVKFPSMKDLTVEGNGLTDWHFMGILQNTDKLQSLTLDGTYGLKDRAFDCIGPFCPSLERLSLCNMAFPFKYLTAALRFSPKLKELVVCPKKGRLSARKVFDLVAVNCLNLTTLTIADCDRALSPATLEAFNRMLTNCVHLRTLSMNYCLFVTDDLLLSVAANAKWIERLDLFNCNVSAIGLAEIALHCTELKYVGFSTGDEYITTAVDKLFFHKETTVEVIESDVGFAHGDDFGFHEGYVSGDGESEGGEEGDDGDDFW